MAVTGPHGCYRVNILLFSWISPCTVLTGPIYVKVWPWHSSKVHISSVESQKGVTAVQRCSIENQKGAIAVQRLWQYHPWTAVMPFWFSMEHRWTAVMPFWFSMEHCWTAIMPFWLSTDDFYGFSLVLTSISTIYETHLTWYKHTFTVCESLFWNTVVVSIAKSHNPNNINIWLHCFHYIKGACTCITILVERVNDHNTVWGPKWIMIVEKVHDYVLQIVSEMFSNQLSLEFQCSYTI